MKMTNIKLKLIYLWYDLLNYKAIKLMDKYMTINKKIQHIEYTYMGVEPPKQLDNYISGIDTFDDFESISFKKVENKD